MKVCILGAGSLGCVFGGVLAEAGHDVLLVNRSPSLVDQLNRDGLRLEVAGVARTVKVRAATSVTGETPFDLIVVLVKSGHTSEAVTAALPAIGAGTVVMSLQNGLGHEDVIGGIVGHDKVMAGKTYVGGIMTRPGYVVAGYTGKPTLIGELDGTLSERAMRIAAAFDAAGLETVASERIMSVIWDKLLVNVATGAVSGITGLAYGDLYQCAEIADCARAAVAEAIAVADAAGIALSTREPDVAWTRAGAGLPGAFKASMLQSLEKGSITEIDYINGAIVDRGRRFGVPTPVNSTLVACIKGIERRRV